MDPRLSMSSILSWNCRGLGNPEAVQSLADLVHNHSPDIVFLCKTKRSDTEMGRILPKLNVDKGVWVAANGRAGGVALLWSGSVDLRIRAMGDRFIDFEVLDGAGDKWRGTGIYGWSESGQKWRTWALLKDLDSSHGMPWLVMGDFNEVLFEA